MRRKGAFGEKINAQRGGSVMIEGCRQDGGAADSFVRKKQRGRTGFF